MFFFQPTRGFSNILRSGWTKKAICFFPMWSVWIPKPGIQLGGNTFHSLMQRIKGIPATHGPVFLLPVSITFTLFTAACSFSIFRWQLTVVPLVFGSCLVLHPICVNQPGPESEVQSEWQVSAASFSFHQAFCSPCRWTCSMCKTQLLASSLCPSSSQF